MKRIVLLVLSLQYALSSYSQQNDKNIWNALNNNDRIKATSLIQEQINNKSLTPEGFITNIYLSEYCGKEHSITDFVSSFYDKTSTPYPYIYALWFNNAVLGPYGKKKYKHQLDLIDKLITDVNVPGSLKSAAHYQKGTHDFYIGKFDEADKEYAQVGNIRNWQYVGPFENISESGFDKNYPPIEHPEPKAEFKSSTNAPIKWFIPAVEMKEGWVPLCYQVNKQTAVTYAQTFINAPADMDIYCNAGVVGAIKVWLNDELIISEYKERVTELDTYTQKCHLKKGYNRLLVQVSYTSTGYPNFTIRLTNEKYQVISSLHGNNEYHPYPKVTSLGQKTTTLIPHFAEAFFQKKINDEPDNLLNYLLLSNVYLRNKKTQEARNLIETALQKAPDNCLLRVKLISVLIEEDNRSRMLEEIELLKQKDPESLFALAFNINKCIKNEKYDEALSDIEKYEKLYKEDETITLNKISILVRENKYDEMIKAVEEAHQKYPDMIALLPTMYAIKKEIYKDNNAALKVYEDYLQNNFEYSVANKYKELLFDQGKTEEALLQQQSLLKLFPYDPGTIYKASSYYFTIKDYDKAEDYIKKSLQLSPYHETYWEQLGNIKSELKQKEEATQAYNKSLLYDPNQYTVISKLRKLEGKPETYKLLPQANIDSIIKNNDPQKALNTDYGYYYIQDETNTVIYNDGATEQYCLLLIKITNEKGIDAFKESEISYDENSQNLLIETSQVYKKSGAKIEGERNGNVVVFTNLEVGDVIAFKYRYQNYTYGRFAKEIWDKFVIGGHVYTALSRYSVTLPKERKINYVLTNGNIEPTIKEVEDFKQYIWEVKDYPVLKQEPLMPSVYDIGCVLHISTLSSWQEIASWYADIINNRQEQDFEVTTAFNSIFSTEASKKLNQFEKAKLIYNYIENNIRYSSVSFRQGAYVPQRPSTTINTRLGDCKDLSALFVTLCKMADINCRMVLINTRDYGKKDLLLPSMEFNHCIVKATLDNKDYYIELTNNYLPFVSLPSNLPEAAILEIPTSKNAGTSDLKYLKTANKTKDIIRRTINIKPIDNDLNIDVRTCKYGNFSANTRNKYRNLDYERRLTDLEKTIASSYTNNIKMDSFAFGDLDNLNDSVTYTYTYKVKNEVAEIGSMHTFKVVYPDVIASMRNFSADTRTYPIEYCDYEDADGYETTVNIEIPKSMKFVELPSSEQLNFKKLNFSIEYKLIAPNKLTIVRKFSCTHDQIPAEDYATFKTFFEKIIKAEQKFIAYK